MAVPTWQQATTANSAAALTASQAITVPAARVNGDGLLLVVACGGEVTVSAPAGWLPVMNVTAGATPVRLAIFTRVANNEPASYTITATGGTTGWSVSMHLLRGMDPISIVDTSGSVSGLTAPQVTALTTEALGLCIVAARASASRTFTPPTGYTERSDVQNTNNNPRIAHIVSTKNAPVTPGPVTGPAVILSGTSSAQLAVNLVVRPPRPPAALETAATPGLVTFATNVRTDLPNAAARQAWVDDVMQGFVAFWRVNAGNPAFLKYYEYSRAEIFKPNLTAQAMADLDLFVGRVATVPV